MALKGKSGDEPFGSRDFPVDVSPQGDGFMLTIGHASIWFDSGTAQEILILLIDALAARALESLASKASS
jgi:hypothetical protein